MAETNSETKVIKSPFEASVGREEVGFLKREIVFRARRVDNGEYVIGNYYHNIRKGKFHLIYEKETNDSFEVYRESLQMLGWGYEWEDV